MKRSRFFLYCDRSLIQCLRFGIIAYILIDHCKKIYRVGDKWMAFAKSFFEDRQCSLAERFGPGVITIAAVKNREIINCLCYIGIVRPERLFANGKCASVIRLGRGDIGIQVSDIVQHRGYLRAIRTTRSCPDIKYAFVVLLRLDGVPTGRADSTEINKDRRDQWMIRIEHLLTNLESELKLLFGLYIITARLI